MSSPMIGPSPQTDRGHGAQNNRAELNSYARILPWSSAAVAISLALPPIFLDASSDLYTHNLAIANSLTAILAVAITVISARFSTMEADDNGRKHILIGGVLIAVVAFNNAYALFETGDGRHAGAGVLGMICTALIYPRLIGLLIVSIPQMAVVAWIGTKVSWEADWIFAFLSTLGAMFICYLGFYLRKFYSHQHHSLLAERAEFIEALKLQSVDRALLQERVLTERNLATLGRLAGGIAHDLNNILVPILGNAAMLEESVHTSTHKRQSREIMRAATRARNLTQQLGHFSSRGGTDFETLELNQLITELCTIVWRTFPQGIDINLNVQDEPIFLRVNRIVLQDLITKLLLEAANAANPASSITLTVLEHALLPEDFVAPPSRDFCVIAISDGAQPMTATEREELFSPHRVGDRGIGLLGARNDAAAFGAFLNVDRASDGSNQFCLFLPKQSSTQKIPDEKISARNAAVAREVLVVDDEPAVRGVTSQLLQREGFVVRGCKSGEEALLEVQSHLPDAIVMDLRMPGMGGRAAMEAIRAENANLPIVICTGFMGDAKGWIEHQNNCALLQKPYDIPDLIKTVNSLLDPELTDG